LSLLTVGHGRLTHEELGAMLNAAGVDVLVDVRRFPGSRTKPDLARESLEQSLPTLGPAYRWEERLGGRRRLATDEVSRDGWWQVEQFRAYAAHTRTEEFEAALADVLADAADRCVAVMCSESVWWRCHRRLIADVVVLAHDEPVRHLMHSGKLTDHLPAPGARLGPDRQVFWDQL
jgi:uncharacterized protein (DUF488 family)